MSGDTEVEADPPIEEDTIAPRGKGIMKAEPIICTTPEEVSTCAPLFLHIHERSTVYDCPHFACLAGTVAYARLLKIVKWAYIPEQVRAAVKEFGFPAQLKIKDSIALSTRFKRDGLASVRIVEREDEAVSVAAVMIRNHELLRKLQRSRRLFNMEREVNMIQNNISKIEKDPYGDKNKVQWLKASLVQCERDMNAFKQQSKDTRTEVLVTPSSRAAHTIADYRGQPLWDPELQSELMECDRASAVLRAAYW